MRQIIDKELGKSQLLGWNMGIRRQSPLPFVREAIFSISVVIMMLFALVIWHDTSSYVYNWIIRYWVVRPVLLVERY